MQNRQNTTMRSGGIVRLKESLSPRPDVANQLGYKHAKYIRGLEFVASLEKIGQGKGGYWEDQGYEWYAGI